MRSASQAKTVKRMLSMCLVVLLGMSMAVQAADEVKEAESEKEFRRAFVAGLELKERVEILLKVVREYPDTAWNDDALWVLGEIAGMHGFQKYAMRFREKMLERKEPPELQKFTRGTWIYRESRIPGVLWVLDRTGHRYHRQKMSDEPIPFNPLPMIVNEDVAVAYQQMGKPEQALKRYREALKCAPAEGLFANIYQQRIQRLEQEIKIRKKAQTHRHITEQEPDAGEKPEAADAEEAAKAHRARKTPAKESKEQSRAQEGQ